VDAIPLRQDNLLNSFTFVSLPKILVFSSFSRSLQIELRTFAPFCSSAKQVGIQVLEKQRNIESYNN
jgi:hypothetical protein